MEILDRNVEVQPDKVVITEQVRTNYGIADLQYKINHIQRLKARALESIAREQQRYDELSREELEFQTYLNDLTVTNGVGE